MSRRTPRNGRGRGAGKQTAKASQRAAAAADYRAKRRQVQPLVSFVIPKTRHPSSAAKLEKYVNYLFGEYGVARGVKVPVRRKDKAKLDKLKDRFGQGRDQGGLPGIKYVFVPTIHKKDSDQLLRPIIRHRKNGPDVVIYRETDIDDAGDRYTVSEVVTQFLEFDKQAMAMDPEAEVRRVGEMLMELSGVDDPRMVRFRIQNGGHQMKEMLPLDSMVGQVKFLVGRYAVTAGEESAWDEWLDGLTIETAENQKSLTHFNHTKAGEYKRRKAVGEIDLQQARILLALERSRGGAATEPIARTTNGTVADAPLLKDVLTSMRRKGLVSGDDNRWMLTRPGTKYLDNARSILPLFNL